MPKVPIKCAGAPQKIMYLSETAFRQKGLNFDMHWYTSLPFMFPVEKYSDALERIAMGKDINIHFKEVIQSVDGPNRKATF